MSFYNWLWFRTEFWLEPEKRRPYTYIIRDFYHKHPILTLFITCWSVYLCNYFFSVDWQTWLLISIGVLLGHLFWGTHYQPDQQEYPTYLGENKDVQQNRISKRP